MANLDTACSMDACIRALKAGGTAIFPTDTVMGVGVSVRDAATPDALFKLKGRPSDKPIAWLVDSADALEGYGRDVPDYTRLLADRFWPGALTLIVVASDAVPAAFSSAQGAIGLRMPGNSQALDLIEGVGCPLATTSANFTGEPAPYDAEGLDPDLARSVDAVLEPCGGLDGFSAAASSGIASTVVDCTGEKPVIVREGSISRQEVAELLENETADETFDRTANTPVVQTEDFDFPSADGESVISARIWFAPDVKPEMNARPKAIIHIVHGMAEYVRRYDDFARYLVSNGFVVCGEDMIGHGRSAKSKDHLGHIPIAAGRDALVADMHSLRELVSARYAPETPYVMLGHSMGSFIARAYMAEHGRGLAAVVISGTGNPAPAASAAGNFLARRAAARKGETYRSAFIDGMAAGGYGKKIANARTPLDWLSVNRENVDSYLADEYCGAMFSVGGYAALTDLTRWVVSKQCAARVPVDLPVLFVAGDGDPVGDNGKGVHAAADLLREAGVRLVSEIIYPGMRHEILNETDHLRVYADIVAWIKEQL